MNKIVADGILVGKTTKANVPAFFKELMVTREHKSEFWPQYEIQVVGRKVVPNSK